MSFNDFSSSSAGNRQARSSPTPQQGSRGSIAAGNNIEALARTLQEHQQNLNAFIQKVGEYKKKRGGIDPTEKRTCESQLNDFRSQEGRILNTYNSLKDDLTRATATLGGGAVPKSIREQKAAAAAATGNNNDGAVTPPLPPTSSAGPKFNMPSLPGGQMTTAETATRRLALSKIGNDINRMTVQLKTVSGEVNMLTVTGYGSSGNNGNSSNNNGISSGTNGGFNNGSNQTNLSQQQQQQLLQFQPLQGKDVDEMIMEERERDINKINSDIILVNEMFKDMANIVQAQQPHIDEVHKSTTDVSMFVIRYIFVS